MIGRTPQPSTTTTGASARKSAKNKKRGAAVPYLDDTAAPYLPLPSGQLNIKRLVNANIAEPSKQKITGTSGGSGCGLRWLYLVDAVSDAIRMLITP